MTTLAHVIGRFGPAYLQRYGDAVLPSQRQALTAISGCRSTLATHMLADCGQCGAQRLVPHSCGHRACPHCQQFEGQRWIVRQHQALVNAPYFLVTFTVPGKLRALVWQHQRALYKALMDCAWGTLATFAQNDRRLRGQSGAVAVLHTHSRRLEFHPHVHLAACRPARWRPMAACGDPFAAQGRASRFCSATRRWLRCSVPGCWR